METLESIALTAMGEPLAKDNRRVLIIQSEGIWASGGATGRGLESIYYHPDRRLSYYKR